MRRISVVYSTLLFVMILNNAHASDLTVDDASQLVEKYSYAIMEGDASAVLTYFHSKFVEQIGGSAKARELLAQIYDEQVVQHSPIYEVRVRGPKRARFSSENGEKALFVFEYTIFARGFPADLESDAVLVVREDEESSGTPKLFDAGCWTLDSLPSVFDDFAFIPEENGDGNQVQTVVYSSSN
ncbi:MAG: hypothetical protein AAFR91_10950 [Pseudomonadota bacterium]